MIWGSNFIILNYYTYFYNEEISIRNSPDFECILRNHQFGPIIRRNKYFLLHLSKINVENRPAPHFERHVNDKLF